MNGQQLKEWREKFGLTQLDVADKFGVSRTTVQNWEGDITPLPRATEMGCQLWGKRLRQENVKLGPVTLIFSDGPMFVDPYGPRRQPATVQQEFYRSNAAVLARVQQLWGRSDFHNPVVIQAYNVSGGIAHSLSVRTR